MISSKPSCKFPWESLQLLLYCNEVKFYKDIIFRALLFKVLFLGKHFAAAIKKTTVIT